MLKVKGDEQTSQKYDQMVISRISKVQHNKRHQVSSFKIIDGLILRNLFVKAAVHGKCKQFECLHLQVL